jgi:hypothetical protein
MYGRGWRDNSSVFALLDLSLSRLLPSHDAIARAICLVAMVAWVVALLRKAMLAPGDPAAAARYALVALIGFFLLSPAVFPWYLAWTLPWLVLGGSPGSCRTAFPHPYQLAWLIFTGTIFGFYAHDLAGHHREIWWVTTLEYGLPVLVALAFAARLRPVGRAFPCPAGRSGRRLREACVGDAGFTNPAPRDPQSRSVSPALCVPVASVACCRSP